MVMVGERNSFGLPAKLQSVLSDLSSFNLVQFGGKSLLQMANVHCNFVILLLLSLFCIMYNVIRPLIGVTRLRKGSSCSMFSRPRWR